MTENHPETFSNSFLTTSKVLYTPSDFAKSSLLHLIETGVTVCHKSYESENHGYNGWIVILVEKGCGDFSQSGKTYKLQESDIVFADCSEEYSHKSDEVNLWTIKYVSFDGSTMKNIVEKYTERGGQTVFRTRKYAEYSRLIDEVFETASALSYVRDMLVNQKLAQLLTLLMEDSWSEENDGGGRIKGYGADGIKNYLDGNFIQPVSLDFLADKFAINKFYMTRIFKEKFGITIIEYITNLKVTRAKRLLRFTNHTIEKIAEECGYEDPNYFARMFKKIEGYPPGEYRSAWLKN